jgi:hypothetical protein
MEKVLTWAQHSSSKGFNLDPNLQRWIEIVGPEWTHIAAKKTFHVSQSDWSLAINQSIKLIDWLEGSIPFKSAKQSSCLCLPFPQSNSHLAKNSLPREAVRATHGTGFRNFAIFASKCSFLKKFWIYEVDLLQGRDILNVKSPVPTFLSFPKPF